MISTIRLAIIGAGSAAKHHAISFKAIDGCQIVAVCDIDKIKVEEFAAEHEIEVFFTDVATMLQRGNIDAVSIATSDSCHAEIALQCIKAGKHVFCEKPLALNYADAFKMLAAARKANIIHMVNFSYRNWSCIQEVATKIRQGDLGEILHVEATYSQSWLLSNLWGDWKETSRSLWRLSNKHSNGVLGDIGVHLADLCYFIIGPIDKVYCQLKTFPKEHENNLLVFDANDLAVMTIEFKSGALGLFSVTRWASGHSNQIVLKIYGARGAIEINSEKSTDSYRVCVGKNIDKVKWKVVKTSPTMTTYQKFIIGILSNAPQQPDFAQGAEIQKLVDACILSSNNGIPVKIK